MNKFFSRLTGSNDDQYDDFLDDPRGNHISFSTKGPERHASVPVRQETRSIQPVQEDTEGELAVDVYQTPDHIVVKALVAGVQPATIDISLTREMLTISGVRADEREVDEDNYYQRELYWGSFSRTILLPEEIDVDGAEASEKHGILMIRLPKINKKRETKLKVRAR
ncbi:Hsp20/alpha crystallin family protein [bacterium]|nr:Hsp20/alpha crystallin family protein [bacterium]